MLIKSTLKDTLELLKKDSLMKKQQSYTNKGD